MAAEARLQAVHGGVPEPAKAPDREIVSLVRAAVAGDECAFARLVARFDRPLRSVARSYRLSGCDVDDVIQSTWMQFLEHGSKPGSRRSACCSRASASSSARTRR